MLPTLRSAWMPQGKQLRVPTPGTSQKKSVFGAMDIRTGAFMHLIFDRKRAVEFIEFLGHIVAKYPTGKIHVILDNYSIHKARSVQVWLASRPRVKRYFLPCYMPQLNSVEKVWWHMKAVVTANRLYGSMAALVAAVNAFFEQLTPSRVQTLAAC
ncbi:MAG: IS630 family transposase [Clostridia bacterium]|nr:IS630 family transposase [Clostridia bacterium]